MWAALMKRTVGRNEKAVKKMLSIFGVKQFRKIRFADEESMTLMDRKNDRESQNWRCASCARSVAGRAGSFSASPQGAQDPWLTRSSIPRLSSRAPLIMGG